MIGSIVLTLRTRDGVKKQKIFNQINTNSKKIIDKKRIPLWKGLK